MMNVLTGMLLIITRSIFSTSESIFISYILRVGFVVATDKVNAMVVR